MNVCPEILNPKELSKFLKIGITTTYRLLRTGKIKSARVGRQYRIRREAVLEYLLGQEQLGIWGGRLLSRPHLL